MADEHGGARANDPYDLARFVEAQLHDYERALVELRAGRKRSHWMWYIFPQLERPGLSATSRRYAVRSAEEARAYLQHPVLGPRLRQCAEAVLAIEGSSAHEIFGHPDHLKLGSSASLFATVSPAGSVFHRLLERYYVDQPDE